MGPVGPMGMGIAMASLLGMGVGMGMAGWEWVGGRLRIDGVPGDRQTVMVHS